MAKQISYRKGTNFDYNAFVGVNGEITINLDTYRLVTHDGSTPGGFDHARLDDVAVDSVAGRTGAITLSTDDINEDTVLYYTDERVDDRLNSLLMGGTNIVLTYDDVNNSLTVDGPVVPVDSVAGRTGDVVLSTDDLTEGANLFYTDERVDDRLNSLLIGGTNITLTYDDVNNSLTIAGPIVPVDSVVGRTGDVVLSTDDVNEGANLYYTNARLDNRVSNFIIGGTNINAYNDPSTGALILDGPLVPLNTVNNRTGAVTITSAELNLDQVPNEDATNQTNWDQDGAAIADEFKWDGSRWSTFTPGGNLSDLAVNSIGQTTANQTLDMSVYSVFEIEPTNDLTLEFTGLATSGRARAVVILGNGGAFNISYSLASGGKIYGHNGQLPILNNGEGFELSTVSYHYKRKSMISNPEFFKFNNDGSKLFVLSYNNGVLYTYDMLENFNITDANRLFGAEYEFDFTYQDTGPKGIAFNDDGTKLFMVGTQTNSIYQYSLSTAFDLNTVSYDNVSFDISNQDSGPARILFNPDGTRLYMVGTVTNSIYQYNLSTGYDLTTASYNNIVFDVFNQSPQPRGIACNTDGTLFFIVDSYYNTVYQYSLSVGYDFTTMSYDNVSVDIDNLISTTDNIVDIEFNNDGTRLYTLGKGGGEYSHQLNVYPTPVYNTLTVTQYLTNDVVISQ